MNHRVEKHRTYCDGRQVKLNCNLSAPIMLNCGWCKFTLSTLVIDSLQLLAAHRR